MKQYYVYIVASKRNGTLYTGFTGNLSGRIYQHKIGTFDGFTKKYKVNRLVYYESYPDSMSAITREKQLKKWYRKWKLDLVESVNPEWDDLYENL